jgi:transcription-repair coupling factor (superfamily II helicase)
VAIRAAFKAVDNSKQVAILCLQHFGLPALPHFYRALKDMPVSIGNRFRTAKQKSRELLKD